MAGTEEKLKRLREITAEISRLNSIQALLEWDQQVNMPRGGAEDRGNQTALIAGLAFDKSTSDELGTLIADLASEVTDLDADDEYAREIKVARRNFERSARIPREKIIEFVLATSAAHEVWVKARQDNDFKSFEPHLTHIFDLRRQQAELFQPYEHPYDALLEEYEPGMKTADVRAIFEALRPRQVELLRAIAASEQVDNTFVKQYYPFDDQRKLGSFIASRFGYDWERGRLDLAPHPFTTSFGAGDVRITTRFLEKDGMSALFSMMHETGHALYDQGLSPKYRETSLDRAASYAIHESQSRLWENMVGRSREFCRFAISLWSSFIAASTAWNLPSSESRRMKPPTTCTSCCALRLKPACWTAACARGTCRKSGIPACRNTLASRRRTTPTASCRTSTGQVD